MSGELKAVLWDMDGTLVDTEPIWWRVETEIITGLGGRWSVADCERLVGSDLNAASAVWMAALPPGAISRDALVERVHGAVVDAIRDGIEFQPGALELIEDLRREGIARALVTASYRQMVDAVIAQCPPGTFDVVVAGDEVTHGKPHPEPYLTAADALGVDPAACVVLEDSPTGAASGNAAGALVVAIPQHVPVPEVPRRVQVDALTRLDAARLRALLAANPATPADRAALVSSAHDEVSS